MPQERGDMKLIGMLDSPYVRRVAISMRVMGLPFEHQAVSVFSHFEQFQAINPVVKAPSLVCDDGQVLMDSTLILDFAEAMAVPQRRLMPVDLAARQQALSILGLALAACEKSVQMIYERNLRPAELWHHPWLDRVLGQLSAAYGALEAVMQRQPLVPGRSQAAITAAVAWQFSRSMLADHLDPVAHPALQALHEASEALPEFLAFPPAGPGVKA
jgi:glutathione S-transferase